VRCEIARRLLRPRRSGVVIIISTAIQPREDIIEL
jgi:hypothetical protein